jgi:DNA-binding NarL/FixJ family response regulator
MIAVAATTASRKSVLSIEALSGRTAVVFDAQPLWLDALAQLLNKLGIRAVAMTRDPDEALTLIERNSPDVLVIGLDAEASEPGYELLRHARDSHRGLKTIVISSSDDDQVLDAVFAEGASALCMRSADAADMAIAIRQSFEQSIYLSPRRSLGPALIAESVREAPELAELTRREMEILRLVAEGYSNCRLAKMLWVTEQTVKFHLSNIYRKLDVSNRTEASRWAQVHGLLDTEPVTAQTAA